MLLYVSFLRTMAYPLSLFDIKRCFCLLSSCTVSAALDLTAESCGPCLQWNGEDALLQFVKLQSRKREDRTKETFLGWGETDDSPAEGRGGRSLGPNTRRRNFGPWRGRRYHGGHWCRLTAISCKQSHIPALCVHFNNTRLIRDPLSAKSKRVEDRQKEERLSEKGEELGMGPGA